MNELLKSGYNGNNEMSSQQPKKRKRNKTPYLILYLVTNEVNQHWSAIWLNKSEFLHSAVMCKKKG